MASPPASAHPRPCVTTWVVLRCWLFRSSTAAMSKPLAPQSTDNVLPCRRAAAAWAANAATGACTSRSTPNPASRAATVKALRWASPQLLGTANIASIDDCTWNSARFRNSRNMRLHTSSTKTSRPPRACKENTVRPEGSLRFIIGDRHCFSLTAGGASKANPSKALTPDTVFAELIAHCCTAPAPTVSCWLPNPTTAGIPSSPPSAVTDPPPALIVARIRVRPKSSETTTPDTIFLGL
mmetsp:Transcript_38729/g.101200  ORF Transcript_38729/g.101200 Transcript_38729/m.101200 type:complete len:239 (+) Transcript_38729:1793-2509(+)